MAKEEKKSGKPSAEEIAARKAAKKAQKVEVEEADDAPQQPAPPARMANFYKEKVVPQLKEKFGYKNNFAVPRLEKIVVSMGLGKYATSGGDGKANFEKAERELTTITGQKPQRCKAKKSVAQFKVRQGMETGLKVTLRGTRMYEFFDRMIALAFPRVKDFRGLNPNGFDGAGNYNFGFNEQTVFPEVDGATVTFQQGMNITLVTTANKPDEGREMLKLFGFPFAEAEAPAKKK
jgi:large subunit ribosomal protein L5